MRTSTLIIGILLLLSSSLAAQEEPKLEEPKMYRQMSIVSGGDTIPMYNLHPVHVFAQQKFKNEKERQQYTKLIRDVKKTYPYAKMISEIYYRDL